MIVDIPDDPADRTPEQQARWILANAIDWHRREEKAVWWEYFRLADLSAEDLLDEQCGLSGLSFVREVVGTVRAPVHRYRFPPQETEIRGREDLRNMGGAKLGAVETISIEKATIDIKKRQDSVDIHPEAVFAHSHVNPKVLAESLFRINIKLDRQTATTYGEPAPLQAGMQLEADVITDSRRLIEWMFEPLFTLTGKSP